MSAPEGKFWTLLQYETICQSAMDAGYRPQTVADYLSEPAPGALILRHDVDRFPGNALSMAKAEQRLGIRSSYYFRIAFSSFNTGIIRAIHELGHEIGYHFEVLSRAGGDPKRACHLFLEELDKLRAVAPVSTCVAHGSPLSKWDNRRFWESAEPKAFGLRGDAQRDIDYTQVAYFTDTGRSWGESRSNLRDRVGGMSTAQVSDSDSLMDFLSRRAAASICLQTHPERWSDSITLGIRSRLLDTATNLLKGALFQIRRNRGTRT